MRTQLEGGCHCGHIRYKANLDKLEAVYCHCKMCQKSFGNIFATFFYVPENEFSWEKNEPTYFDSSKFAKRGFCQKCGTPISFEYAGSSGINLSVGSLDEPNKVKPVKHYGVESRQSNWHKTDDLPEEKTEDSDEYVEKWKQAYGKDSSPGIITSS